MMTRARHLRPVIIFAILLSCTSKAASSLPLYEPFDYPTFLLLGQGDTTNIWSIGNTGTSAGAFIDTSSTLTYSGLANPTGGELYIASSPSSNRHKGAPFAPQFFSQTNRSLYASFLMNLQSPVATESSRLFAGFSTVGSGTGPSGLTGVWLDSSNSLLISKNSTSTPSTVGTPPVIEGDTHLVVLRYKYRTSAVSDDEVALWLDPPFLGVDEDHVPLPDIAMTAGFDVALLQSFWIYHPNNAATAMWMLLDEVRVATNWAGVTPPDGLPVLPTRPAITQSLMEAPGLILRGNGGWSNGVYEVIVATNADALPYQWTAIATNRFDANGSFDCTNTPSSSNATCLYRLLVAGEIPAAPPAEPVITIQPATATVDVSQTAAFMVTATGNPVLTYQWYFNTNTPLPNATNSFLFVSNAQFTNAGAYSVVITNSFGAITSVLATLTVDPATLPFVTTSPLDDAVNPGQTAFFTVAATGTTPFGYQWYFNTNTPVGANSPILSIPNAQSNNAGTYSVVITNYAGSRTSQIATLAVTAPFTNFPSTPDGYATIDGDTTGGAGGSIVTVDNVLDFKNAIQSAGPLVVQVSGTIDLGGTVSCGSDKTIIGLGSDAKIIGDLALSFVTNVIIRNLTFTTPPGIGVFDGITIENGSHHVWIDHCTFYDCGDGELDIVTGSDYVTVSWCKSYYTFNSTHNFVNLIGNNENNDAQDTGRLHVTFHHNWWSTLCVERMPRVRFGQVHVFNNFYDCTGNNYCVRAGIGSQILVEKNYFRNINRPYEYLDETPIGGSPSHGLIRASGDVTLNCTSVFFFNDTVFTPPYSYTLETPATAKAKVISGAGAGIISP